MKFYFVHSLSLFVLVISRGSLKHKIHVAGCGLPADFLVISEIQNVSESWISIPK